MSALQVVLRWLHVVPAVVAGGGAFFAAIAVLPTLGEMPEETRKATREKIAARWRPVVHACIALLLGSGLVNFFMFQSAAHHGQALYQALFGIKFLLAMVVFFVASALTGRTPALQPIRDNARTWAKLNALLILLIILIAGVLRSIPPAGS